MGRLPRRCVAVILAASSLGLLGGLADPANVRADGDPASDVLTSQPLFLPADANFSASEQARLSALIAAAARGGMPIGVAIIPSPTDLGAVTGLWNRPRSYARFLAAELSAGDSVRVLVVMPGGLGFEWPAHSAAPSYRVLDRIRVGAGGRHLAGAAEAAVSALASAAHVPLTRSGPAGGTAGDRGGAGRAVWPGGGTDRSFGLVGMGAVAAVTLAAFFLLRAFGRRKRRYDRTGIWSRFDRG